MGLEAYPFLRRVEVRRRWTQEKATFREVVFEGRSLLIVRCGIGPEKASKAVQALDAKPSAIFTVGTAGALVPGLKKRELIVACETVDGDQPDSVLQCSGGLVSALTDACKKESRPFRVGRLATVRAAVFHRSDRERLQQLTGCDAVDMETHSIALEADRLGVPFTSLRVVSDEITAPPLPDFMSFKGLWRHPTQWVDAVPAALRWLSFMKDFRQAIEQLHPVMVRVIRDCEKSVDFESVIDKCSISV